MAAVEQARAERVANRVVEVRAPQHGGERLEFGARGLAGVVRKAGQVGLMEALDDVRKPVC